MKRPIPPLSVVRLKKLWPHARSKGHEIGQTLRVGYYSRQDGLDCIWLVNDEAEYFWTMDHDFLEEHFEIQNRSTETSFYGASRPKMKPILGKKVEPGAAANASRR